MRGLCVHALFAFDPALSVRVLIVGDNDAGYAEALMMAPLRQRMLQELAGQLDLERITS